MELKEFIEKFADLFDELEATDIQPDTVFKDLDEWSSLTALELIALVDEEFEVSLGGEDIKNAVTLEDLFNTIASK